MRCFLKLRSNVKLEGDLQLAAAELAALTNAQPLPIIDWEGTVAPALHTHGLPLPARLLLHLKPDGIRGYETVGSPELLGTLVLRSTFVQEIYAICNPAERATALRTMAGYGPIVSVIDPDPGTDDTHTLVIAIPIYTILECSAALARSAGNVDDLLDLLTALVRYLRSDPTAGRVRRGVVQAVNAQQTNEHLTHGLHYYKAKFFPRLVRSLLNIYSAGHAPRDFRVLDCFAGSGTALLEAALLGMPATGLDIDPLSVLISEQKVQALRFNCRELQASLGESADLLRSLVSGQPALFIENGKRTAVAPLTFPHWLRRKLTPVEYETLIADIRLGQQVVAQASAPTRDLLRIALSDAVTRKMRMRFLGTGVGRFSLTLAVASISRMFEQNIRVLPKKLAAWHWLEQQLGLTAAEAHAKRGDARHLNQEEPPASVDLIVTSPPYLPASSGRESYAKARAPSLLAIGLADNAAIEQLDKQAVGSMNGDLQFDPRLPEHAQTLVAWLRSDELRSIKAAPSQRYFADMYDCFHGIHHVLNPGGRCLMVVAKQHTFYTFSTREALFTARSAEVLAEEARCSKLIVEDMIDVQLVKANRNARPRSLDDYYETILVLRKPA